MEALLNLVQDGNKKVIHTFLPISRNREVDTRPAVDQWLEEGRQVIVSATDFKTRKMTHYHYDHQIVLQSDQMGIPSPVEGNQTNLNNIDVILVPLLGVDKLGYRIGYGGGYYDQLLAGISPSVLKVGLSLGTPFDQFTFVEPHDIALDIVVTPFKTLKCK